MLIAKVWLVVLAATHAVYAGAPAACNDAGKVYKVCSNQEHSYKEALAKAKAEDKTLIVVMGAEWCPWCISLHAMLSDPAFGGNFAKRFLLTDIAIYNAKVKIPSGESVRDKLKDQAKYKGKLDGIPIMVLVNPKNEKAVFIETEPLEKNTKTHKGHDSKKVLAALEKAAGALK